MHCHGLKLASDGDVQCSSKAMTPSRNTVNTNDQNQPITKQVFAETTLRCPVNTEEQCCTLVSHKVARHARLACLFQWLTGIIWMTLRKLSGQARS
eukprot:4093570-Amphidinium_carterae.1